MHLRRLAVSPGITGLWQVEARQDPSFDSYISFDTAYVENYVTEALAAREMLEVGLEKLGIEHVPGSANFVLGYFGDRAIEVRDALRDRAILVRDRSYEIPGGVRITVGTREQTRRVLAELEKIW